MFLRAHGLRAYTHLVRRRILGDEGTEGPDCSLLGLVAARDEKLDQQLRERDLVLRVVHAERGECARRVLARAL